MENKVYGKKPVTLARGKERNTSGSRYSAFKKAEEKLINEIEKNIEIEDCRLKISITVTSKKETVWTFE